MGKKTATSVMVVAIMAKNISLAPLNFHINIFHHHNGIVNHQSDGEHDCQKREHVNGEPGQVHYEKRTNKRYGNNEHGNNGGPPVAQEEENNYNYKEESHINSGLYFTDGRTDIVGIVEPDFYFNIIGKVFFYEFQPFVNPVAE
jgi:hypothetical protein